MGDPLSLTITLGDNKNTCSQLQDLGNPIISQQVHSGSICRANRLFTSIVVMVLTDWNPARVHCMEGLCWYYWLLHPFSLFYTCVVERDLSELIKVNVNHRGEVFTHVFIYLFIYYKMPTTYQGWCVNCLDFDIAFGMWEVRQGS